MSKLLYLIRHGYALHNELFLKSGLNPQIFRSSEVLDSPLTQYGHDQSIQLGYNWEKKHEVELVVVSPLMRTLETAMNIFGDTNIPIISLEFLREYPLGRDTCNKRSNRDFLENKFPKIDFNNLEHNEDILWRPDTMETIESLENRINTMKKYLLNRQEKNIAIVGHGSYIGHLKDNHIPLMENGDIELKHCHPYEYELKQD